MDHVYVIAGVDAVKVGVARTPTERLAQLQTGNPDRLTLAWFMPIRGDAYAVEAEAHTMLDRHRVGGEWFAVPTDVAVAAVSGAAFRLCTGGEHGTRDRRLSWPVRWAVAVCLPLAFWTIALGPAPTFACGCLIVACLALLWRARNARQTWPWSWGTRAFFVFAVPGLFAIMGWPASYLAQWLSRNGSP